MAAGAKVGARLAGPPAAAKQGQVQGTEGAVEVQPIWAPRADRSVSELMRGRPPDRARRRGLPALAQRPVHHVGDCPARRSRHRR